ncbi:MAG: MBL fold metallo-hydrolase [Peptostreptococcaceae bacterium]|nr:MBL fold metallo-hydrolase [Peptostreptococcaceae bacterium]
MIIKVLAENTAVSEAFGAEHGLSLYIETRKRKLLFDMGGSGLFAENGKKMGVDLSKVDLAFLSHGHYDHGGGLEVFLRENRRAKIYIQKTAFEDYYAERADGRTVYIGLKKELGENERFVFAGAYEAIEEGIELFSDIRGSSPLPLSNRGLMMEEEGKRMPDAFRHEQVLAVSEEGKTLLVTGCAHNGILNVLEHFQRKTGREPDYVVGGFHLASPTGICEEERTVKEIADILKRSKTRFFTGHCTGEGPYGLLRSVLGERIEKLSGGTEFLLR